MSLKTSIIIMIVIEDRIPKSAFIIGNVLSSVLFYSIPFHYSIHPCFLSIF